MKVHNGSLEGAINKFKAICRSHSPKLEFKNVIYTRKARENFAKSAALKWSFSYVYKLGPDKTLSDKLMTELLWDPKIQFPYNLKGAVALASDDEANFDDDDDDY